MIQTTELKKNLQAGAYDDVLLDIYVDADVLPYQKDRYVAVIETYEKLYGADAVKSIVHRAEVRLAETILIISMVRY